MYLAAFSFLLSSVLVVGLWWAARRPTAARGFWGLLAAGWTLNWLGDLAWGFYYVLVGPEYPIGIDVFYLARYLLFLLAFRSCPIVWSRRRGLALLAVALVSAILVVALAMARAAGTASSIPLWYAIGGMVYPVLDAVLLGAAWLSWRNVSLAPLRQALAWLLLALLAYGLADWINYGVRVTSPSAHPDLPNLFWLLSTVFAGLAVWRFLRRTRSV